MPWGHQAYSTMESQGFPVPTPNKQQSVTKTNLSHIVFHNFLLFCSLRIHTKAVREKESIAKGRASCMLWVSNHIMRGLQHLVGAPFIATVKTNMKLFTLTEGVCACMHMCPETDEKLTRGILRMAKKGSQERRKE